MQIDGSSRASRLSDRSELEFSTYRHRKKGDFVKRSKFSEAQIAVILRQAEEGTPVAEVCRKAGVSNATFSTWKGVMAV